MQKFLYFLFSGLIFTIMSCQTIVEGVDLPYQQRLVVTSFISPQDTIIEVKVSKTSPVTGKFYNNQLQPREGFDREGNYVPLEGVTIEMSDGQRTVIVPLSVMTYPRNLNSNPQAQGQIVYANRKGYFLKTKDFPIVAGKSYSLTAKASNFPTVTASCNVPLKKLTSSNYEIIGGDRIDSAVTQYSISNGVRTNRGFSLTKPFTVRIKDYPSEENFYTVAYYTLNKYEYKDPKGVIITTLNARQEPYSDFISDYKRDGGILEFLKAKIPIAYYYEGQNQNTQNPKSISLQIHIANIDKPYYQYLKTISASNKVDGDDPFSEPVLTYTNVQGGLGVFAAFNTTAVTFELLK
jgi:hypothetical protein